MEARDRDLASNLEFWSGRARHEKSGAGEQQLLPSFRRRRFGRPPFRRPAAGGRARPLAAAALLAALAAGWLVVGHRTHASAEVGAPLAPLAPVVTSPRSSPAESAATLTTTTTVPRTPDCRGLSPARREVACTVDGVELDIRLYSLATIDAAYRRAAPADRTARSGSPACARGVPDERAWSLPKSPAAAAGRYRCRFEHERAAMWWTHGDRLVHGVGPDGDLAGLFSWWRAHPSE
jgi:hypothetical protein